MVNFQEQPDYFIYIYIYIHFIITIVKISKQNNPLRLIEANDKCIK